MDNQNQLNIAEIRKQQRLKVQRQRQMIRVVAILLAIVLSIISLVQSCNTQKAIEDLAAQIAAKKEAQAQAQLEAQQAQELQENTPAAGLVAVTGDDSVTLSFVGDVTLSSFEGATHTDTMEKAFTDKGESYFFDGVKSIFEGDDLTVANLEGPLCATGSRVEKERTYHGHPSYASILTAGSVDMVNVANDHANDYGPEGHVDTIAVLDKEGIYRFGNEYEKLVTVDDIVIGFAGIDETEHGSGADQELWDSIVSLKEKGAHIVVVSFHWGAEGSDTPSELQTYLAHAAIDYGADLVIGHHPQVLQGIELYQGKYILYSLGTFLYGGNSSFEDMDSLIFQQTFTVKNGEVMDNAESNLLPCSISSSQDKNDYRPRQVAGEEARRILDRVYTLSEGLEYGIQRPETVEE